jgi:hypothetical protein
MCACSGGSCTGHVFPAEERFPELWVRCNRADVPGHRIQSTFSGRYFGPRCEQWNPRSFRRDGTCRLCFPYPVCHMCCFNSGLGRCDPSRRCVQCATMWAALLSACLQLDRPQRLSPSQARTGCVNPAVSSVRGDFRSRMFQLPPLLYRACKRGLFPVIKCLVEAGSSVNVAPVRCCTRFFVAAGMVR